MKKCILYIVSLGALAMASPLTLQEALDMAKSNNSQIKAERAKVDMAESGKTEARSRFMPKISLSASVTKINDPIIIDLSSLQEPLSDIAGAAAYSKAYLSAYDIAYSTAYDNAVKQTMNAYGLDEATAKSMALTVDSSRDFSTWRLSRSIIIFSRFLPTESRRSRADCSRVRSLRSVNASASLSAFSRRADASASAAFTISAAFSLALAMIAAASFSALSTASFWMRSIRYCKSSAIYIISK